MRATKARVLGLLLTAVVAVGLVAAVAMARSQTGPQRQPQPAEPLPVGGPSQAGLYFPE